jgi:transcriptional regulator with XRE-family HTH domain
MTFNERLRALRETSGMSQEALARASGLSTSAVSKLEQGGIDPSWSTVQKLAEALAVPVAAFAADAGAHALAEQAKEKGSKAAKKGRKKT